MLKCFHINKILLTFVIIFGSVLVIISQSPTPNSIPSPITNQDLPIVQESLTPRASPSIFSASPQPSESSAESSLVKLIIPEIWKWGILATAIALIIILRKPLRHFAERVLEVISKFD